MRSVCPCGVALVCGIRPPLWLKPFSFKCSSVERIPKENRACIVLRLCGPMGSRYEAGVVRDISDPVDPVIRDDTIQSQQRVGRQVGG